MKWKIIFSVPFTLLSILWFYIILFCRVYDVTLDDRLGLLSRMPTFYMPVLFVLAFLCLAAFYVKNIVWSIAFAALFIGYFVLVPWFIEPLRNFDTFYHFSRVLVATQNGHLPVTSENYFDYPGSTIFSAIFLTITGIEPILFLKLIFPLLQTTIFCVGFIAIVKKIFGSWLVVGPSLLSVSLFGYEMGMGIHFSPIGFAWAIIPVLLLTLVAREGSSLLCFTLLAITLIISHPTTTGFLLVVFLALILFLVRGRKIPRVRFNSLLLCVLLFAVITFSWSYFVAPRAAEAVAEFAQSALKTLYFTPQEAPSMVWQKTNILFEISLLRRSFVVISGTLAVLLLALLIRKIRRNTKLASQTREWMGLSVAFVCTGLLLFMLFSVSSNPVFSFEYSFSFGLFGVATALGVMLTASKKIFCLLLIISLALIVPGFVVRYPVEYQDIIREQVISGLQFTGKNVNASSSTVLSPLADQLYSFMDYSTWGNIVHADYTSELSHQVEVNKYFIYRVEGLYYAAAIAHEPISETIYFKISNSLQNNTSFDLCYSTDDYQVFSRTAP